MTTRYFIDTSFVIALEAKDDQYHAVARDFWAELEGSSPQAIVTTSFIVAEVAAHFQSRRLHAAAVAAGSLLIEGEPTQLVHVDGALFDEAWRYLARHRDKSYSLTDCVSFVLMQRLGLRAALTFDRHFVQAGFERRPGAGA